YLNRDKEQMPAEEILKDLGINTEMEEFKDDQDWDNEDLTEKLIETACELGDDPNDEDWLLQELRKKKRKTIYLSTYKKGHIVMSKSKQLAEETQISKF
ncbi:hypothetical protein C0995_007618, partial [Termitomyces sp. Mi166